MRLVMLLSILVGCGLWAQAFIDQSQIWFGFAIYWTLICAMWAVLRYSVKWIRPDDSGKKDRSVCAASIVALGVLGAVSIDQGSSLAKVFHLFEKKEPAVALAQVATSRFQNGHFLFPAKINGRSIDMMVDTGSSLVLLTHEDALSTGIDVASLTFNTPVKTANGDSFIAKTTLPELYVNGVLLADVAAAVAKPGQLHRSLLGMSFIRSVERVVIEGDQMTFRN